MPTEQEQLQLVVTLVDNASAGLDKITEKVKEMGGPQVREAHEKMKRGNEELNKVVKELSGGFGEAYKAVTTFSGGLLSGVAGLAAFGVEAGKQLGELKKLAEEMRGLGQAARNIGISAATMKNFIDAFEEVGVSAEQTKANMQKMNEAVADLSRQGSKLYQELMHNAGPSPESQRAMTEWIAKIRSARSDEERYTAIRQAADNVYTNALLQNMERVRKGEISIDAARQEAANRRNEVESHFWDTTMNYVAKIQAMEKDEQEYWNRRVEDADALANKFGAIKGIWSDIANVMHAPTAAMENLKGVLETIQPILESIRSALEWIDAWAAKRDPLDQRDKEGNKLETPVTPLPQNEGAQGSWLRRFGDYFADKRTDEEKQKAQEDNTKALKELNDAIKPKLPWGYRPTSGEGFNPAYVQNASLTTGGGPSYGGGPGGDGGYGPFGGGGGFSGVPGGGGTYGGGGGGAGGSGTGGYGGGGGAPYGSDTGGTTGGPHSGAAGDPSVPSDILAKARSVALHGGPGAVESFMRSQGYPKAGSWCGEFAASVVKSVGGKPPPGAAVASNWRNWGTPVAPGDVQPGDIAVRKFGLHGGGYVPTGQTGSHVTVVEGTDPKSGRFTGLGGNQGRFESQFALSQYEFRRSTGAPPNGQTAGPGTGAGAGDTPAHADGAAGAGGKISGGGAVNEAIRSTAGRAGMDEAHWKAIASIESSLNPSSNANARTQYKGLFQIGTRGADSEWARRGHGSPYDPQANAETAAALAADNNAWFKQRFGRDPSPTETYMMHQQGRGFFSRGTLTNVAGNPYPGMRGPQTTQSFEAGWGREIERRAQRFAADRQQVDSAQAATGKIEGSGKISVDVNAPKGTTVGAQGGGIFKDVEINRQTQMEPAKKGPETLSI
jgi:hypothetical protein